MRVGGFKRGKGLGHSDNKTGKRYVDMKIDIGDVSTCQRIPKMASKPEQREGQGTNAFLRVFRNNQAC